MVWLANNLSWSRQMPLAQYGVLIGTLYTPQEQTYQGNWFHGVFFLTIPGVSIPVQCVTDFSSATQDLIQYKIFNNLDASLFSNVQALPDGYTSLAATPASGALDYVRSPLLGGGSSTVGEGWITSDGVTAVQMLQGQLSAGPQRIYVFGEPFTDKAPVTEDGVESQNGMHNVHMNQGDPAPAPGADNHQVDDGIWQDGATIFENADGSLTAFCSKFVTQVFDTNDQGLPA
jgi:hypothetical protein